MQLRCRTKQLFTRRIFRLKDKRSTDDQKTSPKVSERVRADYGESTDKAGLESEINPILATVEEGSATETANVMRETKNLLKKQ